MNNMKVSVIVPVFNQEPYICDTLNSIINQDFEDYEIIVIDDGSKDKSLEIIHETLDASDIPNTIIHHKNHGVSYSRNKGIDTASGDIIVFVDGDDIISPNHLKNLYNPDYDFSLVQLEKVENAIKSKAFSYDENLSNPKEFIKKELLMEIPFNFCQLSYKRDLIIKNNITFPENVIYGEDTYFALKALIHGANIHISNEVTYSYIQHSQSAIKTSQLKRLDIVWVFERLSQYYQKNNQLELANLVKTSRIPKAIFGNMNYFFTNNYDFDEIMAKIREIDGFNKLSKFKGSFKFKLKIKLFLISPKIYYKLWMRFKNSID